MANCKKCGAEIVWAKQVRKNLDGTLTDVPGAKANPIDRVPTTEGTVVLDPVREVYRFATGNEKDMAKYHGKKLYRSHFETCPNASDFRSTPPKTFDAETGTYQ